MDPTQGSEVEAGLMGFIPVWKNNFYSMFSKEIKNVDVKYRYFDKKKPVKMADLYLGRLNNLRIRITGFTVEQRTK